MPRVCSGVTLPSPRLGAAGLIELERVRPRRERAHDHGARDMLRHAPVAQVVLVKLVLREQFFQFVVRKEMHRVVPADQQDVLCCGDLADHPPNRLVVFALFHGRTILEADQRRVDPRSFSHWIVLCTMALKSSTETPAKTSFVPTCHRTRSGCLSPTLVLTRSAVAAASSPDVPLLLI